MESIPWPRLIILGGLLLRETGQNLLTLWSYSLAQLIRIPRRILELPAQEENLTMQCFPFKVVTLMNKASASMLMTESSEEHKMVSLERKDGRKCGSKGT